MYYVAIVRHMQSKSSLWRIQLVSVWINFHHLEATISASAIFFDSLPFGLFSLRLLSCAKLYSRLMLLVSLRYWHSIAWLIIFRSPINTSHASSAGHFSPHGLPLLICSSSFTANVRIHSMECFKYQSGGGVTQTCWLCGERRVIPLNAKQLALRSFLHSAIIHRAKHGSRTAQSGQWRLATFLTLISEKRRRLWEYFSMKNMLYAWFRITSKYMQLVVQRVDEWYWKWIIRIKYPYLCAISHGDNLDD